MSWSASTKVTSFSTPPAQIRPSWRTRVHGTRRWCARTRIGRRGRCRREPRSGHRVSKRTVLGRDLHDPAHVWLVLKDERPHLTVHRLTYLLEEALVQAHQRGGEAFDATVKRQCGRAGSKA